VIAEAPSLTAAAMMVAREFQKGSRRGPAKHLQVVGISHKMLQRDGALSDKICSNICSFVTQCGVG
jgi:hypothetical protein